MLALTSLSDVPADLGRTVVTMGNFDGVHLGHQALLRDVVRTAQERDCASVAITFEPHPLRVLFPEKAPEEICDLDTRVQRIAETGVDVVLVLPFTRDLAAMTPQEYVQEVLVDGLHMAMFVSGKDTRFGVKNSGDVDTMRELGEQYDFEVKVLEDVGDGARYSSTAIRAELTEGDVTAAAAMLGRPHSMTGEVVRGFQRGREMGFPTANLARNSGGMVPADGIYAGYLLRPTLPIEHPDRHMPAAISVGTNPTFDGTVRTVEAYVLDRDDLDLYDEKVTVEFVQRLRGTIRFDGMEPLIEQMNDDVARARQICPPVDL